ncbi:phosphatase PAP2 family protein [Mycetocola lacteus]|nr:phosphatase PAP2 family protein [Mycetocola lacteus]
MTIRQRRALSLTGVALLAAFAIILVLVVTGASTGWDRAWMQDLLPWRESVPLVSVSLFLNVFGSGVIGTYVMPLLISGLLWWRRGLRTGLYFLIASLVSALLVQLVKKIIERPRPEVLMVSADHGSFPSGHTANAATMMIALALIFGRWWIAWIGTIYVVIMALSRNLLGAHWFTDTLAGATLGAGIALLAWLIFFRPGRGKHTTQLSR